ncbi:MAG TPA: hypothetical protein VH598_13720 [Verrucomicrobiae bacterium]|nr:hypothetical protein [Verrucomicrobiae bacterium]
MSAEFYLVPRDAAPRKWDVLAPPLADYPQDCHYFGNVLAKLAMDPAASGLTFVVTWDIDAVPFTGPNVVVLLIGDERYQLPAYAGKVLAVFKTGGLTQFLPPKLWSAAPQLIGLELLRALRNQTLLGVRLLRHWLRPRFWDRVFPVPLGYFCHVQPAFRPAPERRYDVFSAAIVNSRGGGPLSAIARSPKQCARNAMMKAVQLLKENAPNLRLNAPARRLDFQSYAEAMMDSKICLCPRGNFIETFRHLEAARSGCVIVSESLPPLWYYTGIPIVQVDRWEQMPGLVCSLLREPARIEELSAMTLQWWKTRASEEPVAAYISGNLRRLRPDFPARPNPEPAEGPLCLTR